MAVKKRGLGRGLNALLGDAVPIEPVKNKNQDLQTLPIEFLQRGKFQPRKDMKPEALRELSDSIRSQGIIQPIVVRAIADDKYEIVAGERRWRAAQIVGLARIPALIKDVPDEAAVAMALIENIQREDLNPIEEAVAFSRLQKEFELTKQEVAKAVGKSRSAVTNIMRLMSLQSEVKKLLEHGDLEMGHARALLTLPEAEQLEVAHIVVAKGLSVRQTESLVRRLQRGVAGKPGKKEDPDIKRLEEAGWTNPRPIPPKNQRKNSILCH